MKTIFTACRSFLVAVALAAAPAAAFAQTDTGLEPAGYVQLGLPSADSVWTTADFIAAGTAIANVPVEQLPRWRNSRSSPVFARFVDERSIEPCRQAGIDPTVRLQACIDLLNGFNGIVGRYVTVSQTNTVFLAETPPLIAMMLRVAKAIKPASDEFAATLDRNDPTYADRMSGLAQMHRGLLMITQSALMALVDEREHFSDEGCREIAVALADAYPVLAEVLPPAERAVIEQRMRQVASSDRDADVRAALASWAN